MIRHTMLLIAWLAAACLAIRSAHANTFSATYTELARSPANFATTWYDGAVTRDGKFIYGLGNSHNAYGNNGLWLYDPATDTHESAFPDTGGKWKWDVDASNKVVPESGRWADPASRQWTTLDPGEGWGNAGMVHSSGKLILMGGGIDGPEYHNKFVHVGDLP